MERFDRLLQTRGTCRTARQYPDRRHGAQGARVRRFRRVLEGAGQRISHAPPRGGELRYIAGRFALHGGRLDVPLYDRSGQAARRFVARRSPCGRLVARRLVAYRFIGCRFAGARRRGFGAGCAARGADRRGSPGIVVRGAGRRETERNGAHRFSGAATGGQPAQGFSGGGFAACRLAPSGFVAAGYGGNDQGAAQTVAARGGRTREGRTESEARCRTAGQTRYDRGAPSGQDARETRRTAREGFATQCPIGGQTGRKGGAAACQAGTARTGRQHETRFARPAYGGSGLAGGGQPAQGFSGCGFAVARLAGADACRFARFAGARYDLPVGQRIPQRAHLPLRLPVGMRFAGGRFARLDHSSLHRSRAVEPEQPDHFGRDGHLYGQQPDRSGGVRRAAADGLRVGYDALQPGGGQDDDRPVPQ